MIHGESAGQLAARDPGADSYPALPSSSSASGSRSFRNQADSANGATIGPILVTKFNPRRSESRKQSPALTQARENLDTESAWLPQPRLLFTGYLDCFVTFLWVPPSTTTLSPDA